MGSLYSKCRQALAPSKIVISLKTSVSGRFEFELKIMVPEEGLEPSPSCEDWILSPARLPIPPLRQCLLSCAYK